MGPINVRVVMATPLGADALGGKKQPVCRLWFGAGSLSAHRHALRCNVPSRMPRSVPMARERSKAWCRGDMGHPTQVRQKEKKQRQTTPRTGVSAFGVCTVENLLRLRGRSSPSQDGFKHRAILGHDRGRLRIHVGKDLCHIELHRRDLSRVKFGLLVLFYEFLP